MNGPRKQSSHLVGPSFQVPMAYLGARADWCCLHEFLLVSGRGQVRELTQDGRLTSVCSLEHENLDLGIDSIYSITGIGNAIIARAPSAPRLSYSGLFGLVPSNYYRALAVTGENGRTRSYRPYSCQSW